MKELLHKLDWISIQPEQLLNRLLFLVVVLLICWLLVRIVRKMLQTTQTRMERFDAIFLPVLTKSAAVLIYVIGIVVVLDEFGVNTTSMIAMLGAAGLAIGLALKDTLQNIASGIMLLLLRPFSIGEYIEFGSSAGTVKEVNIFTTILQTPDGLFVSTPNSALWASTITNFSRNGRRRLDVVVSISYGDSIETGMSVLQGIVASEPRLLPDPAPEVMVVSLAESSVDLQIRAWIDIADFWNVKWDLNRITKERIEAAGLTIPFPQRDVHMIGQS